MENLEAENPILPSDRHEINEGNDALLEEARYNAAYDTVSFGRQYVNPYRWNSMSGPIVEGNLP